MTAGLLKSDFVEVGAAEFQLPSRAMQDLIRLAQRVAATRSTVLISGPTGVGKEVLARCLHTWSPRAAQPLIVFHCAGIPETLLESELFGHERGAFTGAAHTRLGLFERAHSGTLLLEEVGDVPPAAQAKLLRILQDGRFTRLGGASDRTADVRVIATTQYDLRSRVAQGAFREDLLYRLNVFPLEIPALRERREDIPRLAEFLLERCAKAAGRAAPAISEAALATLMSFDWPGNVRQLQGALERALLLCDGRQIEPTHLPDDVLAGVVPPAEGERPLSISYAERLMAARALHECEGNLSRAAAQLGVSVPTLRQMLRTSPPTP